MTFTKFLSAALCAMSLLFFTPAQAAPEIGKAAPDFTATNIDGKEIKLSSYKGKTVVLEWTNHKCPFVVKHYESGNMQKLQKDARANGVEWISIVSSAPGRQGHVSAQEAKDIVKKQKADPSTVILDESGAIGKLYDAQTTPHMFVINKDGILAYAGAIDSNSSPRQSTIKGADNYVVAALSDLEAGRDVATSSTQPYGCSVKY